MQQSISINSALPDFDQLPDSAHVRFPVVKALYDCSAASVWRGVKNLTIPKPHKLFPRTTCWNVGELKSALVAKAVA
ncbi:transcriptional regulator [Methylotenera sp.]|uniref:helix-turn-helix transcriptional regulator n=1 Tax=Methylotenera sp. TaxID=2051956 RepID=UPI002487D27B|nr:transcriptional regulator [Methylotenera sp.]MDI1298141.1 transcriptional regulator [Methylotenera sp.]